MDYVERKMNTFLVGKGHFAAHTVTARHLAMVGCKHKNCSVCQLERVEFPKNPVELPINRSSRIEIKIVEPPPTFFLRWDVPEHIIPHVVKLAVGFRSSRSIERLRKIVRKRHIPRSLVEVVVRRPQRA